MHKHNRLKMVVLVLCACFLLGPVQTAYADLDPDILEKAYGDDGGNDGYDDSDDEEEEVVEEVKEKPKTTSVRDKYQPQIDNINDKIESLREQQAEIEASIKETKSAKADALANKNYLDQQIDLTKSEIYLLEERVALLEDRIAEKEEEIEQKQAEINEAYELFKVRLRAMQLNDETSTLGLLFGSDNFVDFLTWSDTIGRIADHDQALMEDLNEQREALEDAKAELEEDKAQELDDKVLIEEKKQVLSVQQEAAQIEVYNLESLEKEYMADLEKSKAAAKAMEDELNRIYQEIRWSENPYVGGEMAWPLPGYYTITSAYGWRFSGSDFHTGMDISGGSVYGKPIIAANDGTVVYVQHSYSQGVGYGKYLMIDHGGGVSTLYAHTSNIYVSVGDEVKVGDTIAAVGSTGWSTGPHLHFEVRINGQHTNPYPYVTGG